MTARKPPDAPAIDIQPLTPDRWEDFAALFGPNGAVAGCWCMWWRQTAAEFGQHHGQDNREAMRSLVARGDVPGLIAYHEGKPAGWVSCAPRQHFGRIERSRTLKPIDAAAVWSVVCFFIDRRHRHQGVGQALLLAAVDYAAGQGARIVEGYPIDPAAGRVPGGSAFTGLVSMYRAAGFEEAARRSRRQPIMRYLIPSRRPG